MNRAASAQAIATIVADAGSGDLGPLLRTTEPLAPDASVLDVAQCFLAPRHAGLLSLPVVDAMARPLGVISRYALMSVFLQPFGRELFGRRPITALMNREPLVLTLATSLDEAARAIAVKIASPITEDFVLVDGHGYLGTGVVLDVLRAMEDRLGKRSGELERAYARLKASQMQLVQSGKMASLGQMVAGLAHEINTPLGYVRNNVEMVRAALADAARLVAAQDAAIAVLDRGAMEPSAEIERHLAGVAELRALVDASTLRDLGTLLDDTVHGVGQIGDLVADLKDFSRLDQAGMQKADLNRLVESALKIVQHILRKRGIGVVHEAGEVAEIECAPAQISQVLLNLITNAAQAIEHARGRIVVRTQALDCRVLVVVEDNGRGIAPDVVSRIFDPFFTTKPVGQGTGMGLAISHQIVEQHGGAIRVVSKPGVGTRFLVVLPVSRSGGSP